MNDGVGRAKKPRFPGRLVTGGLLAVALVLATTAVGWSFGNPGNVSPGTVEQGQGADVGERTPVFWVWSASQIGNMPKNVPPALSTSSAAPTQLPASSSSFRINPANAGNTSVRWTFTETTAGPGSTELELRFTAGLTRAAMTITVYLETHPGVLRVALTYSIYWDAGAVEPSGITVQTMQVNVLVCAGIGLCP